jgi:uncharacterized protein
MSGIAVRKPAHERNRLFSGRREGKMAEEHVVFRPMVPLTFTYNYRVGRPMETYLRGLAEKKILGVRCPKCRRVLLPPRSACGACATRPDEWVEVPGTGTLENFTVAHVTIEKGEIRDLTEPAVVGMIRLDGADSLLTARVEGIPPGGVRTGLRVRAVWKDPPEGTLHDLDHFEPLD